MLKMVIVCYSIFPEHFVLDMVLTEHLRNYDSLRNVFISKQEELILKGLNYCCFILPLKLLSMPSDV